MRKKAFTLIELMGVLTIIGILAVILVPVVNNMVQDSKDDVYNKQLELIKLSAKNLASDNQYILPEDNGNETYITLGQLRTLGYAEETIINPLTNENFSDDLLVTIIKNEKDYDYEVDLNSGNINSSSGITVSNPSKSYIKKGAQSSYIITASTTNLIDGDKETDYYINIDKDNIKLKGEAFDTDVKYKVDGNNGLYKLTLLGGEKEGSLYFNFENLKSIDGSSVDVSTINNNIDNVNNNKQIIVDNTAPTINFTTNGSTEWSKTAETKIEVNDNGGSNALDASTYKYVYSPSSSKEQELNKIYTLDQAVKQESGDGEYYLVAQACDKAGNCTKEVSNKYLVDNTAPTCSWTGENTTWTNNDVTVTVSGSDSGSGMKTGQNTNTWSYTTNNQEISTAALSYTISDNAGNTTTCSKTVNVYHDTKAPTCSWIGENTTWTNNDVTITVSGSDSGSGMKTGQNTNTWSYTTNNQEISTAALSYTISDNAGNTTTCSKTANVYHDTKAPTINNVTQGNCSSNKREITITASDTSGISGYAITSSNTAPTSYTASSSTSWTSSTQSIGTYYAWVKDKAGNVSSKSITLTACDTTAPTITFGTNGSGSNWVSQASTTVTVTDNDSGVKSIKYGWSNDATSKTATTSTKSGTNLTLTPESDGNYYLYVEACDYAENCAKKTSNAFKVDVTAPSITGLTHTTRADGLHKEFTVTDNSSGIYQYGSIQCDINYYGADKCYSYVSMNSYSSTTVNTNWTCYNTGKKPCQEQGYALFVKVVDNVGNESKATTGKNILPYNGSNTIPCANVNNCD